MPRVLVVDDEKSIRVTLRSLLQAEDYQVAVAAEAAGALDLLKGSGFDVIVSDIVLPQTDGIELLSAIRAAAPHAQVIMMTGEPTVSTAAEALRLGAFDYLTKPFVKDAILRSVGNAVRFKKGEDERRQLERENAEHRGNLEFMVSELRQEVEQRQRAERAKDDFIGMVSHELRTPLAILQEAVSLLLDQIPGKLVPAQERLLKTAQRNTHRLATLIDDLLDVSALDAGKLTMETDAFDFVELMNEVCMAIEPLAVEKGLEFKISHMPEHMPVVADRDRMYQVLMNIAGNAVKYTEKGSIDVRLDRAGDQVRVRVKDTGIGIPSDSLPNLFERFHRCANARRTGPSGTGLGLFITRQLVALHGGTIDAHSEEGKGSTFTACIPCGVSTNADATATKGSAGFADLQQQTKEM